MTERDQNEAVNAWLWIPERIEGAIKGLSAKELDESVGPEGLSARETVHHLAEANIVAASIIIAALGASGSTYDWSWLYPDKAWVKRLGYDTAPIDPALETLRGLCAHISNIITAKKDALQGEVKLFDSPAAETYTMTVRDILKQEVAHVEEHLQSINDMRKT